VNRGAVVHHGLVSQLGLSLKALGERRVGEDYWSVLEQTLTSCLYVGKKTEAEDCLKELQGRFGVFSPRVESTVDGSTVVTPQSGSYRVHLLDLLIKELSEKKETCIKAYEEVRVQKASLVGPGKRIAALVGDPHMKLSEHLEAHPGDSPAWHELGEHYASHKAYAARTPLAIHCYEELVLSTPNAAAWHARLADLHCALHADSLQREGSLASLRQARLHAAEAVRLTDGGVAYALAALADSAYLHVCSILCAVKEVNSHGDGGGAQVPPTSRLLKGHSMASLASHALAFASKEPPAAQALAAATLDPPKFNFGALASVLGVDGGGERGETWRQFCEEAVTLHRLALQFMQDLRVGGAGEKYKSLVHRTAIPSTLSSLTPGTEAGGGGMLSMFPALAVEYWLLESLEARHAANSQAAHLKILTDALNKL